MVTIDSASSSKASNLNGDWTFVSHRRRHRGKHPDPSLPSSHAQSEALTLTQGSPPTPWTPSDSSTDPDRVSNLLRRLHSSIRRLESSRFYGRFLSRLRDPQIQAGLALAASGSGPMQLVVYGVGSIESYETPRLQLALALALRRELGGLTAGPLEVFDPVLSAVECEAAAMMGCAVTALDEGGRRAVSARPALFYMPHCEAKLYDNLLGANWKASNLRRMVVLGNSFSGYQEQVELLGDARRATAAAARARHVLGVRRHVRESPMEECGGADGDDDGDEDFFRAFHSTSWHFFEIDDDPDLDSLYRDQISNDLGGDSSKH